MIERVKDPWKHLRQDLFGNTEPTVALEAITVPFGEGVLQSLNDIEALPARAAGTSYGTREKFKGHLSGDPALRHEVERLNKHLIKLGHLTPLEAIQFNFFVSGISKACGAQVSRHRVGQGHVSASRRFKTAGPSFVYPLLDYIEDKEDAEGVLNVFSRIYKESYDNYSESRTLGKMFLDAPILRKQDARMIFPVSYATERSWWINARALRDFFRLRLDVTAEWEIRRLAWIIFDMLKDWFPSIFGDMGKE
jgi:flavin-dependent thymidylate synthase